MAAIGHKVKLKNDIFLSVAVGVSPNYLLSVKSLILTNEPEIEPSKIHLDNVREIDLSGVFSLDYTAPVSDKLSLNVTSSYIHGFLSIFENLIYEDLKPVHKGFNLTVGLNYSLGKKTD